MAVAKWEGESQLSALCRPFRSNLVHSNPSGGGQYVAHDVVTQKLLMVVGPFDFELREIIRGHVPAIKPNPNGSSQRARDGRPALDGCVVGVICRLTLTVDGRRVSVEEAGDCEDPHNWPHDGARMKDAMSDAIKRCAMRTGVGIHLWAQNDFILQPSLLDRAVGRGGESDPAGPGEHADVPGDAPSNAPGSQQQEDAA